MNEEIVLKYIVDKLPVIGAFVLIAYYMIKSQLSQLKKEIDTLRAERKECEISCKAKVDSYNADMKHLETSMIRGFEEIKIAIAEIRTELKLYK